MKTIYLDMDGVIANFDKAMLNQFDTHFPNVGHNTEERWDLISTHCPRIYRDLEPMNDARGLVDGVIGVCSHYDYVICVLTALPKYGRMPTAKEDKIFWLSKHFPLLLNNFNIGPHAI